MKISVSGLPERFKLLADCGFDACDFSLGDYLGRKAHEDIYAVTDEMIEEQFTAIRKEAEAAGIEIGQTHGTGGGHPRSYDFDYDEMAARAIASVKATHFLGCKYCVVHPVILPGRKYDKLVQEAFDKSVEFYRRLIPTLEKYDVYCCIENMWVCDDVYGHICSTILSHAQEMVDMCNVLGDRFRICYDTGHATLTQDDPIEYIRICGDKLAVLHTHDNDGILDLHTFPYSSHGKPYGLSWKPMRIDWEAFMHALDEIGYEGNLNFEMVPPGPLPVRDAGFAYLAAIARYLVSLRDEKYR